ncbi:MAG: glycosyltransferase [Patescibacteria group bacterium]|nr:glycosyltransferase [Patescibacteria group bacterium]
MPFTDSFFALYRVYARKFERHFRGKVTLVPTVSRPKDAVLLSYVTHPFAITKKELDRSPHTNPWECLIIAEILLEQGFAVDVIDWTNTTFIPKKDYAAVIDVNQNLERLTPFLNERCVKIFYITGAHWRYQNEAEQGRLKELKERRECILEPRRQMNPSNNIEYADYASALGNGFAKDTFSYANKDIVNIPLLSAVLFPSPERKDFKNIKKNFVWIGGGGASHKGLDRVLEAFAQMPEYKLTVCGPVATEKDFVECYKKELYETPNIKLSGRIDVRGEQFKKIVDNSVGLIYPSCSEGQAGSVITGLHAGLIPIITRQSGVNAEPFGIELKTASIQEIIDAVKRIAALTDDELKSRSLAVWNYAQKHHTKEQFKESYASFMDKIMKEKKI